MGYTATGLVSGNPDNTVVVMALVCMMKRLNRRQLNLRLFCASCYNQLNLDFILTNWIALTNVKSNAYYYFS